MARVKAGRVHLYQVAVCDPTWQAVLRSCAIGFPLRAMRDFLKDCHIDAYCYYVFFQDEMYI